jgi:hypothetical protein
MFTEFWWGNLFKLATSNKLKDLKSLSLVAIVIPTVKIEVANHNWGFLLLIDYFLKKVPLDRNM